MTSDELRRLADDYFAWLAFALKHGPDAAHLLADAMDYLASFKGASFSEDAEQALLDRFVDLGVSS